MKTAEEIVTEIYKRSITHIEGIEYTKLNKSSVLVLSEVLEAMEEYARMKVEYVTESWRKEEQINIEHVRMLKAEIEGLQKQNQAFINEEMKSLNQVRIRIEKNWDIFGHYFYDVTLNGGLKERFHFVYEQQVTNKSENDAWEKAKELFKELSIQSAMIGHILE